jgi:biopolymer transport protein ExbB
MSVVDALQQLLLRAGASWVLWLLALLSIASVGVMLERALVLRRRGTDLKALAERLDPHLARGDHPAAIALLHASGSVAGNVAAAGLRLAPRGPVAVEHAMHSALALERGQLERGLAFLGTLGNNAPFVGLLGTVIGVVGAFEELGHAAPGHGTGAGVGAASQVASQAVMSSIAEALVATAVGLLVALPAVAAYNFFQRRIAALCAGSEVLTSLVLAYLSSKPAAQSRSEDSAHE